MLSPETSEPRAATASTVVADATGSAETLVARARSGDVSAFEELVRRFEDRIYGYLFQFTRNAHDAEDLAQVTFVKAFRNLKNFGNARAFAPWLFVIAKRTALNHLRDARPTRELEEHDRIDPDNPATQLESKDHQESVWTVARRVSPQQYEALWLRYGEGFSIKEVAKIMKTNQARVRILLFRGRNRLAKLLRPATIAPGERGD